MIDPELRERLIRVERIARLGGLDLFESLDQAGLLHTVDRAKESAIRALSTLLDQLETFPTHALVELGGGQNTAADAHHGITELVKILISAYEKRP